jgi:phage gp29-like protein
MLEAPTRERKRRLGPEEGEELTISSEHNMLAKYALADSSPDVQIQKRGYKYFEEMELRDTRYRSFLWTRKSQALHKGWDIEPASGDPQDQGRADCARASLLMAEGSFKQDLRDMLDAIAKGYKLLEKVYGIIPSGDFAGKIGIARFKALPQWDYGPVSDDHRRLLGVAARFSSGKELLPLSKFILHVHDPSNEDPLGRGVASPCSWWYWFKHEGAKWWAIRAERYAMPVPVIKEPRNPSAADRKAVKDLIKKIQSETGIVLPYEFALDLLEAKQEGIQTYDGLIALANVEMAMAVLGSTLAVQEAKGGEGSYAQAKEHGRIPSMYADEDADNLEETVQEQVIKDLDDLNFGMGEPYPLFRIIRQETKITRDDLLNLLQAQRAGMQVPRLWAHERFKIPVPAEGEDILVPLSGEMAEEGGEEGGEAAAFAEEELVAANREVDALLQRAERLALGRYEQAFEELKTRLGKKKA